MTVMFIELEGPDARERLERLQGDLRDQRKLEGSELLESVEQPGLHLLICRGRNLVDIRVPEGARAWSFRPAGGQAARELEAGDR